MKGNFFFFLVSTPLLSLDFQNICYLGELEKNLIATVLAADTSF